jgi:hypothetical protein
MQRALKARPETRSIAFQVRPFYLIPFLGAGGRPFFKRSVAGLLQLA